MLVLADVYDAEGLVRDVLTEWARPNGARVIGGPAHGTRFELVFDAGGSRAQRSLDLGDLVGEMHATVWLLYAGWDPDRGLSFASYASGLLRRRLSTYIRDNLGSTELYRRNGRGSLHRVYPKAHAPAVCVSIDGLADERAGDDGDDRGGSGSVDGSFGTVSRDFADDRSFDLARVLNG